MLIKSILNFRHPLFPLLCLLFERCEQATQSAETPNSESFNLDIQAFVQHQERDRKPFLVNDSEIDGLMIKAIQVLRIHLLELEKVQELCKDFCNRYITCLKGKMQSENLLRSDYATGYVETNNNNSSHSSDSNSPTVFTPHSLQVVSPTGSYGSCEGSRLKSSSTAEMHPHQSPPYPSPIPILPQSSPSPVVVHGNTPLSQIGANPCPPPSEISLLQGSLSATSGGSGDEDDEVFGGPKKQKRGVLPKHATAIMRSWLFQHLVNPYPKEDEKREIAAQTNLTLLQVNNWFINARRRILQPMLDASTPNEGLGVTSGSDVNKSCSSKKNKNSCNGKQTQAQRFWPNRIARLSSTENTQDSSLLSGNESDTSGDDSSDLGGNALKHCSGDDSEQ
uniref:Homeobox domain-containing protein n=1 Tax=Clastoptera arizonana TaxID=38151 RepID=A0A1B6DRG0_9HEMI